MVSVMAGIPLSVETCLLDKTLPRWSRQRGNRVLTTLPDD